MISVDVHDNQTMFSLSFLSYRFLSARFFFSLSLLFLCLFTLLSLAVVCRRRSIVAFVFGGVRWYKRHTLGDRHSDINIDQQNHFYLLRFCYRFRCSWTQFIHSEFTARSVSWLPAEFLPLCSAKWKIIWWNEDQKKKMRQTRASTHWHGQNSSPVSQLNCTQRDVSL